MDKGLRPIPALYACYLLRSTVRHGSLYVGSTPDPVRRLKQHNGVSTGGATRTSKDSLRPWEVTCLVTGFPSKIAALQFEWAWQNTHLTRHIAADMRITQAKAKIKVSLKTGRIRKRTARPRLSLTDRIANLHLLLQACSFERWPLRVTFYVQDVYKMWQRWVARNPGPIAPHITVLLDATAVAAEPTDDIEGELEHVPKRDGLAALRVDYSATKTHLEKGRSLLQDGFAASCAVCNQSVPSNGAGVLVCSGDRCPMNAHIACLSKAFLQAQPAALVPTVGQCPVCTQELNWVDLVRELSLRMRGENEITKLFKPSRTSKQGEKNKNAEKGKKQVAEPDDDDEDEDTTEDEIWHNLSQDTMNTDDIVSPGQPFVHAGSTRQSFRTADSGQATIEDSDWDEAEILT